MRRGAMTSQQRSHPQVVGPLAPLAGELLDELKAQGYSPSWSVVQLRLLAGLSCWLEDKELGGEGITAGVLEEFSAARIASGGVTTRSSCACGAWGYARGRSARSALTTSTGAQVSSWCTERAPATRFCRCPWTSESPSPAICDEAVLTTSRARCSYGRSHRWGR